MKTEEKIKPVKSNKKVKTEGKGVKGEEKRAYKHPFDLDLIVPWTHGQLNE